VRENLDAKLSEEWEAKGGINLEATMDANRSAK